MRNTLLALFMGTAMLATAPLALRADEHRVYDRDHKDYHAWNDGESKAYRHWLMEERHERQYRSLNRLSRTNQSAYWQWRHEHQDWH